MKKKKLETKLSKTRKKLIKAESKVSELTSRLAKIAKDAEAEPVATPTKRTRKRPARTLVATKKAVVAKAPTEKTLADKP